MNCPKCKENSLVEIPISHGDDASYKCTTCKGLFVTSYDQTQLDKLVTIDTGEDAEDDSVPEEDSRTGLCPKGCGLMIRALVDIEPPFHLERCPHCGGRWFDRGEWHKLSEHHLLTELNSFWTNAYQRRKRQEKSRQHYLEAMESQVGKALLDDLENLSDKLADHKYSSEAVAFLKEEIIRKQSK